MGSGIVFFLAVAAFAQTTGTITGTVVDGHPHTEMLHITERLHRADLGHLEIEFTIEDPGTYSKPWVIKRVADLDTNDEIGEYVCIDKDAPHMVGK